MSTHAPGARTPAPGGPYCQAVVSCGQVFCSGTFGVDPATGRAAATVAGQTEQALANLAAVLAEHGSSMRHLAKVTVYYVGTEDFAAVNEAYARHVPVPAPARSVVPCTSLPEGLLICVDAVAALARHPEGP